MKAFVTTVHSGSMSAAAEQLNITSAMVGQHIASLESRLGTRLLNRTTRRQNLTDFGESYLEQCLDILERVAVAEMEAEAQSSEARGTLRITAPVTFGSSVLMPVLVRYRRLSPRVKVDVVLTDQNLDLIEERVDLAFRIGEVPDSRLIQRKLMPYKMVLCASPDYLRNQGVPEQPEDLAHHELVRFAVSSGAPLKLFKNDEMREVSPSCMVTMNSGQALVNAALRGLGIIVQPEVLVKDHIADGTLRPILPDWQFRERPVSLLYYRDQKMTPRVRSFIECVMSDFQAP